jgi:hypothetical protein
MPQPRWDLIDYVENKIEKSSTSYFDTTVNLIKWNTALAVGAILWFGNFIVNDTKPLGLVLQFTAYLSLLSLVITIAISIGIFFGISRFFNTYWVICSKWRESFWNYNPDERPVDNLINYYRNLPEVAKTFDFFLLSQIFFLALGMGAFVGFIIAFKSAPV